MTLLVLVLKFLAAVAVFGIALTFAARRDGDVKVEPRSKLPLVALVFALLNALLYSLLATVLNLTTLWLLFFLVPFVVNGVLLLVTDKLMKSFRIDSISALVRTAAIVTVAHLLLRIVF